MALTCRTGALGFLTGMFLVWAAATAQQQYKNPDGYACNGRDKNCSTFALYRTFQAQESLQTVADYFNTTVANVSDLNGLAADTALSQGQPLYIPLDCSCQNATSQMQVPYIIAQNDTFYRLSATTYGGLTKYEAMMYFNPTKDIYNLQIGDAITVPIFCACPTAEQIANGTTLLLTYAVYPGESLDVISGYFGTTTAQLGAANQLAADAILVPNTTLLVPLVTLPPIATMSFLLGLTNPSASIASQRRKAGIIAGVSSAAAVAALLIAGFFIVRYRRRTSRRKQDSIADQNLVPRTFTFKELRKATKSFSRSELLGSGGSGAVYKGTLPSSALVAVKRMRMESKHGKESFQAEIATLSHIRHRNLVQLRGWCQDADQLLVVYDYMCNGSLDDWLFHSPKVNQEEALPLSLRYSVLSGVAAALAYLHEECAQCVLHRDIKSSNVLLDGHWNAYLGDFGLARLIDHQKMEKTTMMAGTFGYMAPEMPHTGKASKESDVYSFGVLMLEVVCGKRALHASAAERGEGVLVNRVWRAHEAGNILEVADSRLLAAFPPPNEDVFRLPGENKAQEAASVVLTEDLQGVHPSAIYPRDGAMDGKKLMRNLLHLGLLCCNPNPEDRPSMRLVSQLLQMSENMEMSLPPLSDQQPRSYRSWSGLSRAVIPWSTSSGSNGQVVTEGLSQSSSHPNFQASFAAPDSSVFCGR